MEREKNNLNPKFIEEESVYKLKEVLRRTYRIEENIQTNDKTPSWDGDVILYNDENLRKDQIYSITRFQVKGKNVEKFSSKYIKYPIEICDLRNYYNDGGAIYVVGEVLADKNQVKLFYKALTPLVIKDILKGKEIQKTVTVKLSTFPVGKMPIINMLKKFDRDKKNQPITIIESSKRYVNDFKEHIITPVIYREEENDIFNNIGNEFYIYGKDCNLNIPLDIIKIEAISFKEKFVVSVDEKVHFESAEKIIEEDGIKFIFGKTIILTYAKSKGKLEVKFSLDFNDLETVEFLLAVFKSRRLCINSVIISDFEVDTDIYIEDLEELHINLLCIEYFCKKFNLKHNYDIMKFTLKGLKELREVQRSLLSEYTVLDNRIVSNVSKVIYPIGNSKLMFLKIRYDDGSIKYLDYFENIDLYFQTYYDKNNFRNSQVSNYVIGDYNDFLMSNFNKKTVLDSLLGYPLDNEEKYELMNRRLLEILKAYDISDNKELLELASEVINFIKAEREFTDIDFINETQIFIRAGRDISDRYEKILKIKSSEDTEIKCACCILLKCRTEFEIYFKQLSKEAQENFLKYPINNLLE